MNGVMILNIIDVCMSPTRTDYARSFTADEGNTYERHLGRGRSKSPLDWKVSSRIPNERPRFREDSSDDDDNFLRDHEQQVEDVPPAGKWGESAEVSTRLRTIRSFPEEGTVCLAVR